MKNTEQITREYNKQMNKMHGYAGITIGAMLSSGLIILIQSNYIHTLIAPAFFSFMMVPLVGLAGWFGTAAYIARTFDYDDKE